MNLFFPHGNGVLQSPMHALAAEQSDVEAEERAGLRPWRMGAVGCMAAKAPGRARRKGSNGRDGLASCMATTRRKRKPHGQRRVAQCGRFNCSCGKQTRSDVIPRAGLKSPVFGNDFIYPVGQYIAVIDAKRTAAPAAAKAGGLARAACGDSQSAEGRSILFTICVFRKKSCYIARSGTRVFEASADGD